MADFLKSYLKNLLSLRFATATFLTASMLVMVFLPVHSERKNFVGKKISKIDLYGLVSVSEDRVYDALPFRRGDVLKEDALNEAVKNLFATGDFEDVEIRAKLLSDGTVLLSVILDELPRIKEIIFVGEQELYEADLKTVLPFKEGDVFHEQQALDGIELLKEKYRDEGFLLAELWVRSEELSPGEITITYLVDEGQNIPITRINITGTKKISPVELLDILEQKEEGFLEDGIFRESKFEEDKFKILAYAKTLGYVNAEIDPAGTGYEIRWRNPKKPEDGRVVVVTYRLIEGDIRYFGGYSLEHDPAGINEEFNPKERKKKGREHMNPVFTADQLISFLEFEPSDAGQVFDEGKYFRDRNTLQQAYSTHGYVFAQIQPYYTNIPLTEENLNKYEACQSIKNPTTDDSRQCADIGKSIDIGRLRELLKDDPKMRGRILRHVHFVVRENNLAYIENIIVKGMKKTQENVIRRELLIKEGQLFNSALVERSREKVFNLGYFKEVNLDMRPGSDDKKMNLVISVIEQPTGTITLGGTYGTASGFSVYTELGENNLFGTGQRLSGKLQYGPTTRQISTTWIEPWIYESCDGITGRYWYNKQRGFDEAPGLLELNVLTDSLRSENESLGKVVKSIIDEETASLGKNAKTAPVIVLDRIKMRIRTLMRSRIEREEECYRGFPSPWALSLSAVYSSYRIPTTALTVSNDSNDMFEGASYDINAMGLGVGVSHSFLVNWAHYHRYSPSWSVASRPTSLANDEVIRRANLGWQFKSSFTNGLIFDSRDNVFNPTSGFNLDLSVEMAGQMLGGQDHFNRYKITGSHYFWPIDYSFYGLFKSRNLKRWRVVVESRVSATFTHETAPFGKNQDKTINPFLEAGDRLYLGGYESLRGYEYRNDPNFPAPWWQFGGSNHLVIGSLELRLPIEPSTLWWTFFVDAGSGFVNLGELTGNNLEYVQQYDDAVSKDAEGRPPLEVWFRQTHNLVNYNKYPYDNYYDWNDPRRAVLTQRNLSLDRMLWSWGFGLRVQIPVLPIRLFMAQKMAYNNGRWAPIPGDSKFNFVFGIGDYRF